MKHRIAKSDSNKNQILLMIYKDTVMVGHR